jgi:Cu/Ag efflux protein CusF
MRTAKIILASATAVTILMSVASAQEPLTGTVTQVDRLNGTIAIRQTQSGTVGSNTADAAEEFKISDGPLLTSLHAGDRVTFSLTESGGAKTITNLKKQ